jgi:hypothetical protein
MIEFSWDETLEIRPFRYSATWLIGATTHAVDRFVPNVERIFEPARDHIGGTIRFSLAAEASLIPAVRRTTRRIRYRNVILRPKCIDLGESVSFDVRSNGYFNWSHQVNFFLTLALAARSRVQESLTIILPSRMPGLATQLYAHFGFAVVSTDGPVRGRNFGWEVSHPEVVASGRPQLIAPFMSEHDDDPEIFPSFELPKKVFLSRRGTRSLSNEGEVEQILTARGFAKVYAEDLTIAQQFALMRQADEVVAIHGAGLAPLEYRSPSRPGLRLLELAPAGIVTRWFGIMCEQVGGKYIAVRGRIKPEYVKGFYAHEPFEKYCNDNFEIDPKSLEVALEMIGSPS